LLLGSTAMPTDSPRERREHDRKAPSAPRPGLLFIVSRDALDYYEHLRRAFAGNHRVAVILDRRSAERRKTPSHRKAERRRADRHGPGVDQAEGSKRRTQRDEDMGQVAGPPQRQPSAAGRDRQPRQVRQQRPQQPSGAL